VRRGGSPGWRSRASGVRVQAAAAAAEAGDDCDDDVGCEICDGGYDTFMGADEGWLAGLDAAEAAERASQRRPIDWKAADLRIWALALPSLCALLMDPLASVVDSIFVSQLGSVR